MLVLTRKPGQSIVIGNTIRVTLIDIAPGAVKLGFTAPGDVSIYREEIYDEIAASNRAASHAAVTRVAPDDGGEDP